MCLSVPARLLEQDGARGVADVDGNRVAVDLSLVEDARPGDYVLVHAGFAIQKYEEAEALETLAMLREALGDAPEAV